MTCKIPTLVRKFAAEFLGTMILVVFGCGAALLFSPTFPLTTLTVALAFGLVIIAMATAIGDISGCHINPAVSLAMLLDGRMGIGEFFTYLAAQFLGGIAGGGVLALISNGNVQSGLGSNGYLESASSHISILGAFVIEIILTFVFVFVVLRVTKKAENGTPADGSGKNCRVCYRAYADTCAHLRHPLHRNLCQPRKKFRPRFCERTARQYGSA